LLLREDVLDCSPGGILFKVKFNDMHAGPLIGVLEQRSHDWSQFLPENALVPVASIIELEVCKAANLIANRLERS
jgi:hypothetical protein